MVMIVVNCMMVVMVVQSGENESCCLVVCFVHLFFRFSLFDLVSPRLFVRRKHSRKEKRRQSNATPSPFLIISVLSKIFTTETNMVIHITLL